MAEITKEEFKSGIEDLVQLIDLPFWASVQDVIYRAKSSVPFLFSPKYASLKEFNAEVCYLACEFSARNFMLGVHSDQNWDAGAVVTYTRHLSESDMVDFSEKIATRQVRNLNSIYQNAFMGKICNYVDPSSVHVVRDWLVDMTTSKVHEGDSCTLFEIDFEPMSEKKQTPYKLSYKEEVIILL